MVVAVHLICNNGRVHGRILFRFFFKFIIKVIFSHLGWFITVFCFLLWTLAGVLIFKGEQDSTKNLPSLRTANVKRTKENFKRAQVQYKVERTPLEHCKQHLTGLHNKVV